LQTILHLVDDPIPNIRFNVAKSLEVLATALLADGPAGQAVTQRSIVPAVEALKEDTDADVRFFANRALEHTLGLETVAT